MSSAALDAIHEFRAALYGDTSGYLHVAVGVGGHLVNGKYKHSQWSETVFEWPREADRAARETLSASTTADAYDCAALMRGIQRAKGAAVERRVVHADVDGQIDVEKVSALGGFAVASGSEGHAHAYVKVAEPLTVTEYDALCRGLGRHLGATDAKVSDNDLLRPAGTLNHKAACTGGEPTPVRWLVHAPSVPVDKTALARRLRANLSAPATTRMASPASGVPVVLEPVTLSRHPRLRAALNENTRDRSADTMRIVRACYLDWLTLPQARWAVNRRTDLATRLAELNFDDVLVCWLKAIDRCQLDCAARYPSHIGVD